MPKVGSKKFSYTKKDMAKAKAYVKKKDMAKAKAYDKKKEYPQPKMRGYGQ